MERELLADTRDCLLAGIEAAHPETVLESAVRIEASTLAVDDFEIDLDGMGDVIVVGGGNAGGTAAAALEGVLGERIDRGLVVTDDPRRTDRIDVIEGTHPLPSEANVEGARGVLETARSASEDDVLLAIVSGGGSALLCAPAGDISLADFRSVTDDLLKSGADIGEINAVRKHCSAIKGGQLARAAAPERVIGLVFSDVVGNPLDVIASGPTAPDATTYEEALAVLDRYGIQPPATVRERLEAGAAGDVPETPRAGDEAFDRVSNRVLADADTALDAAADAARDRGYEPTVLTSRIRGEAREAAKTHVALAEEIRATDRPAEPPAAILTGGETTVTVRGDGWGGPNLEFALSAAVELDVDGAAVGSVDTDGIDGGSDVAGAVVDAETVGRDLIEAARNALADNDAGGFLSEREGILGPGPTGTNVNDLRIVLVRED